MNGINVRPGRSQVLRAILIVVCALVANGLAAKDTLQIDRAFLGATDAWRDVTAFLRQHLSGDALSVTIAQPFTEIGGDPAPGKGKNLIVDYRLNGRAFRLWLVEKYPVAFTIRLPSPEAKAPGADSQVRALLQNIF
ncbi:MAG TPA: hypothetical protein VNT26_13350, partial [Candidatus Sulfotelmatobacter sp.]|nr:hypothetical protein [Candidatus Sulfotelmatobacter sp.]